MATETITRPTIQRRPEFAAILRDEETFAAGTGDDTAEQINSWFDRLMMQSGMNLAPSMLLILCVFSVVALGGLAFIISEHLLLTGAVCASAFPLPIVVAVIIRFRRQNRIMKQMPGMVGELARAARSGRSLPQCFELVATDTKAPLGTELRRSVRKTQMGMNLPEAIRDLPARTGVVSLRVLVTALTVHQQMGGDLPKVLDRLARTISDRISFIGRVRAATAASRATAILMIVLPPLILGFFLFRDPNYFNTLTGSQMGRMMTLLAVSLQCVGTAWVLRILKRTKQG